MRSKTGLFATHLPDRLRGLVEGNRQIFLLFGSAISGYIISNSFLFGSVAPFGAAFIAALPWRLVSGAAVGAILGHIIGLGQVESMKYIAAILFTVVIKWTGSRFRIKLSRPAAAVGTAFSGMLAASVVILLALDPTLYDLLLAIAELLLAAGAAYFFSRTLCCLELGFAGASRSDSTCMAISFLVVVMGFEPIAPGGFSLGRILCVLAVLLAARYGGEGAGAISGIAAGFAMGLAGNDFGYTVSSYAFGGLMSGIFGHIGSLAAASAFVVINALCAIFIGQASDAYTSIGEIFIASIAFMVIPRGWLKALRITGLESSADGGGEIQAALKNRMENISLALRDIGSATREINRRLGKREGWDFSAISATVAERVCRRCGMRASCWQSDADGAMAALDECVRILKRDGSFGREQLPRRLAKNCCRLDRVLEELNTQFQRHISRDGVRRKVSRVRSVITDQFEGMAMMIDELAEELSEIRLLDTGKALRIGEYFEREGIDIQRVFCWRDEFHHTHIQAELPAYQKARLDRARLACELSAVLECDFDEPVISERGNNATVILSEKAAFTIEMAACQISGDDNRVCGDRYEFLREQAGRAHLILSDGMGSGSSAAVDSSMASGLIARLLSTGVGHEAALKMVNSAMLVKSGEESLATIDICSIDLYSGEAEIYKAGAAPTYLLRSGKAGCIESVSLPAGILRGVSFEKSAITLREGDIVIMVSDGVTATGSGWIIPELQSLAGWKDMQKLCERLADTARLRRQDGREDDITVITARLNGGI